MGQLGRIAGGWLFLLAVGAAQAGWDCDRVVSIGDIHGDLDAFVKILRTTGLVDEQLEWADDRACLVQLGDFLDRGAQSREVMELLIGLQEQHPERVEVLLGNHEILNLIGDLRYVTEADYAAFAEDETPEERAAAFEAYRALETTRGLTEAEARLSFDQWYPAGWFARRRAFLPDSPFGAWLLERPVAVRIGGAIYIHAGLQPQHARVGLDKLSSHIQGELRSFLECRGRLEESGWIPPFSGYADSFRVLHRRLESLAGNGLTPDEDEALVIAKYVAQLEAASVDPEGPMWYRGLAEGPEAQLRPKVREVLELLDAERLVLAHTPLDGNIRSRFGGRVFLIDTLAGPAFDGQPSALEIDAAGTVHAVYEDRRVKLADPLMSDAKIEAALRSGEIVEMQEIGSGITRPHRVTLSHRGRTFDAAFKTVDIQKTGVTRFEDTGAELNFTDNYRYERAAYLLDRELGMEMVPVAVLRKIDGTEGALVQWIDDAIDEADRREESIELPDPVRYKRQQDVMIIFDMLLLNADRNLTNQLHTFSDGRLHLIDHSRTFRLSKKLPAGFESQPVSLPRPLYERLKALETKPVKERLKGLVSAAQVKALIARRDRIVAKVEADLAEYGEAVVFHPETEPLAQPAADEMQAAAP